MKVYTGLVKYPDALKSIELNKGYQIYHSSGSKSYKIHIMDLELSILTKSTDFSLFRAQNESPQV